MPYANPEDKKAHNKAYHDERKVALMIARLQKAGATKVTQYTYDLIKDEGAHRRIGGLRQYQADLQEQGEYIGATPM
jgi:hypothetical protein